MMTDVWPTDYSSPHSRIDTNHADDLQKQLPTISIRDRGRIVHLKKRREKKEAGETVLVSLVEDT